MKIVLLDKSTLGQDIDLTPIEKLGELVSYELVQGDENIIEAIGNANIIITNKVIITKNIMEKTNIKLICISATGMNNVDLPAAKELGIEVMNVADYSTSSVAQVTLSYVFKFIQHLDYYDNYTKEGKWINSKVFTNLDAPFNELNGKNWGIIGLGNIGNKVAQIATVFGCNVSYYSTSGKNNNKEYEQKDLNTLLSQSDIISIHCALNESTKNLLNNTNLNLMKDKVILINVGRGGIINEQDLVEVFNNSKCKVALDTIEIEPMHDKSALIPILGNKRFICTPHIAWSSIEARALLIEKIVMNIKSFNNS
ncbi:MAG: D-2-hydroxyacid dehydrogenase [Sulfurovum sp.]